MSKKTYNKPKRVQFIYFLLIFVSGGGLFYLKTLPGDEQNIWVLLILLLGLLYGLMKSTRNWAYDNPKTTEKDEEKDKPVYQDRDIPSLEEMVKKKKESK